MRGRARRLGSLVRHWAAATGRPVDRLAATAVTARAWEMLFAARETRPDWAEGLTPLDLDAEEQAHEQVLAERDPLPPRGQRQRAAAADAAHAAAEGDTAAATEALHRWAEIAREIPKPDAATLAACRHVAPLLVAGVLAVEENWAWNYTAALIAALDQRYRVDRQRGDWAELIEAIMRLRGEPDAVPPPSSPAAIEAAERGLGVALSEEFRAFLRTCDGLRADVVFPRLLGVADLTPAPAQGAGAVTISEPPVLTLWPSGEVTEDDDLFGRTVHPGIRSVLEEHLRLLEASEARLAEPGEQ
ncbi:SMI1/KNR4 family protein [Saccharomonospora sp. CUA-673]|uniref:SMI1/KNR4 family protein n=1 Tax=Saccharomonospora sp. CUA-673 TaxID=1904969 RepID=UPI003510D587